MDLSKDLHSSKYVYLTYNELVSVGMKIMAIE